MLPLFGILTRKDMSMTCKRYNVGLPIYQNISHLRYPDCLAALSFTTLIYSHVIVDVIETFKIINKIYDSRHQVSFKK